MKLVLVLTFDLAFSIFLVNIVDIAYAALKEEQSKSKSESESESETKK